MTILQLLVILAVLIIGVVVVDRVVKNQLARTIAFVGLSLIAIYELLRFAHLV